MRLSTKTKLAVVGHKVALPLGEGLEVPPQIHKFPLLAKKGAG